MDTTGRSFTSSVYSKGRVNKNLFISDSNLLEAIEIETNYYKIHCIKHYHIYLDMTLSFNYGFD